MVIFHSYVKLPEGTLWYIREKRPLTISGPFQAACDSMNLRPETGHWHGKHGHVVEFCTANKSRASFGFYLNISGIYVDQSTLSPFILISEVKTSTRPRPKLFPLQQKHQLFPEICCWSYSTPYIKHYKTMCFLMFPSENDSDSLGSDIFGHQNDSPGRSWHLRNWLQTWFRTSAAESAGTKG